VEVTSREFKAVAAEVSGLDGIASFLDSYRQIYGSQGALTPVAAAEPASDVASAG